MQVLDDVYPSRGDSRPRRIERMDPVVHGIPGRGGPLDVAQVEQYARDGFLVVPSLFSPVEVAELNAALTDWVQSEAVLGLPETIAEPGSDAVRSVFRVHDLHPLFHRLACDPRLRDAARQILGGEVYIHQSRVNLKPGFRGKEFYWHSDFETWHMEDGMPRMRALSVSLTLTDNYHVNGPLMLIPGSHMVYISCVGGTPEHHYRESLKKQEYGVPDEHSLAELAARGGIEAPVGPAGMAVFFDCNTMHGSSSNISPYPRHNVFFVYNSVENRLRDPYCGRPPRPEYIATRTGAPILDGR
jgi:ectoine hydroxylase